jgi:acyl-CoA thioester hydrolase
MDSVHDYPYTVTAEDIDDLGHAGNYHFIRWMQYAAIAHSTALGWSAADYDGLGAGWVVRSHQITYLRPAFEGDVLRIRTWVANLKSATSLRRYRILNRGGELLARAETDWAFTDYRRQRAIRIPAEVRASFVPVVREDETGEGP